MSGGRTESTGKFDVTMTHTEESLLALSHMQYDLFCTRNFIVRNVLSITVIVIGAMYIAKFWGIALIAYGGYLMTSAYSSSNHTVKKLVAAIEASGKGYPSSRYLFTEKGIEITFHPGKEDEEKLLPVGYSDILKLGENADYCYLFPSANGGYCVPKKALGERQQEFVRFIEGKTGKKFYRRRPSPLQRIRDWLRERNSEPYHL
ncbi:MAG: YcxB family protein [Oscillospiraceae bacterium]|nr:YcxB family protein [Oscillospiraceae bacterium]